MHISTYTYTCMFKYTYSTIHIYLTFFTLVCDYNNLNFNVSSNDASASIDIVLDDHHDESSETFILNMEAYDDHNYIIYYTRQTAVVTILDNDSNNDCVIGM